MTKQQPVFTIVGAGYIGTSLAEYFQKEEWKVDLLSARNLINFQEFGEILEPCSGTVLFAHGKSVNVRNFGSRFKELLESRIKLLEYIAPLKGIERVILISSTAAGVEGGPHSLPAMQRLYERRFNELFADRTRIVLRVGTLVGKNSQFSEGLELLRRTWLLKRLRSCGTPVLAWADMTLVQASVQAALKVTQPEKWIVAYRTPLDLNQALDSVCPGFHLRLPQRTVAAVYRAIGVRSEFMDSDLGALIVGEWRLSPAAV